MGSPRNGMEIDYDFSPDNHILTATRGEKTETGPSLSELGRMGAETNRSGISNRVWLKTKGDKCKEFRIAVTQNELVFSRPSSSKN